MSDYESACGGTYDHVFTTDGPVDGLTVYVCIACGAEIMVDEDSPE